MMANQMVDYAVQVLAPKLNKDAKSLRMAIIHEDGGFGTSTGTALQKHAKALGLNIVAVETYSAKTADLSGLVLKLKQSKPDVLLTAQYINDSILFHRQSAELRFSVPVIGTTAGQGTPDFYSALTKEAEGILAGGIPSEISIDRLGAEQKADAGEFVKRYQASHNGEYPSPTAFVGFAGAWILYKHIMPKAGGLDPEKLREAALALDVPPGKGVLNWGVKFSPPGAPDAGQNVYAAAGISQWQDGKLRLVFPKEIAAAEVK